MSTLAAAPNANRAPGFWASTVGKKIVMAVTGVILFGGGGGGGNRDRDRRRG